jgi:hypothetical protein
MAANERAVALEVRARRAYEMGRLRAALRVAPFVLAAAAAAVACGRPAILTGVLASTLLVLCIGVSCAGGPGGRGVMPGLVAGAAPLGMPLLMATVGHACFGPACMALCLPACVVGGAVAGVVIARSAARREPDRRFVASAVAVAALTGALGCTIAGVAGVLGMLAGTVAAGAPVLVAARR